MKPEDQIKALAEMDGWKWMPNIHGVEVWHPPGNNEWQYYDRLPPVKYLESYDAIIPVAIRFLGALQISAETTPEKLCELVLRKSGKWICSAPTAE